MHEQAELTFLPELILFLVLAGVLIPLLQRWRVNSVLAFLALGSVFGPYGVGQYAAEYSWLAYVSFPSLDAVRVLAELGILFLLFTIGLELSVERLLTMRLWVFGAGSLQLLFSALLIGGLAWVFGNSLEASLVLGLVLSFSSTAVVMQLLTQRSGLATPVGRAAFSLLLFQDLAVVPVLILVGILGVTTTQSLWLTFGVAVLKGGLALLLIYVLGRRLLQPVFHRLVLANSPDTFMALTLLSILGIATLTWLAGLSLALGAFLAGLLLAETEYRHAVIIAIEPFKGLLMGLFFMSVGMGVDLAAVGADPFWLVVSVLGLIVLKALVILSIGKAFKLPEAAALELGLLLGQGGEFAFIVIAVAMSNGLLQQDVAQFMLLVVSASLFATPLLARFGQFLHGYLLKVAAVHDEESLPHIPDDLRGHVVIAGFGRVGQLVAEILSHQQVAYIALDSSARRVAEQRANEAALFYGDASRVELLRRAGVAQALAVVLTMDNTTAALQAMQAIRKECPHVSVVARARDERHAEALQQAGAKLVVLETLESSLRMAGFVLTALGLSETSLEHLLEQERQRRIQGIYQA